MTDAKVFGWAIAKSKHNWKSLVEKKNREISRLNKIYINNLNKAGVDIIHDHGSFVSSTSLLLKKEKKVI